MKLNRYFNDIAPRTACRGIIIALTMFAAAAQAQTPVFTNVWSITNSHYLANSSFLDLTNAGDLVRGLAVSPVTTNVIYASRAGGSNHIATLDGANGYNRLGSGSGVGITSGTLALMGARVSDDGKVYACNLSGGAASQLKIYRWESDTDFSTDPKVVYANTSGASFPARLGDYMDLRGSGANTEIVLVGNGSAAAITTNFVILKATDAEATNFTATSIYLTNANVVGGGVAFEGTNNVIYVKAPGAQPVRRVVYDPIALTSSFTSSFNMDQGANNGLKYYETNGYKLIATVMTSTATTNASLLHRAKVLQLTSPSNAVIVLNQPIPGAANGTNVGNGNSLGLVDVRNGNFAFSEPNNGITFFQLTGFVTNTPPALGAITGGGTYVEGYPVTLSVSVTGPGPLGYQWYFNTNTLISTTSNFYAIPSVNLTNVGVYNLIVTNPYGISTSGFSGLSVVPAGYSPFASNLWTLAPGSRGYLTATDTQRGIAYDAVSNVVVIVSRSPSNAVYLIDANTGADVGSMNVDFLYPPNPAPPGTLPINMCGVADDGAVYVGNLQTSTNTELFTIYRWPSADPAVGASGYAYQGNPLVTRLGDTMAVRGSGVDTEILCSFRTGTNVALFTTADGVNFSLNVLAVTNLPADAQNGGFAGLGLAFGAGKTFWAKSSGGFNLRRVAYDTNTLTAEVVATYTNLPSSVAALGVDNVNGFVATVGFSETPRGLSLWDITRGEPNAALLDRELFGSSSPNLNGTGAVAVDVAGGRIFALDSNNGLIALAYPPTLFITPTPKGGIVTWSGPGTLQAASVLTGPYLDVSGATSPHTNTAAGQIYFRVRR